MNALLSHQHINTYFSPYLHILCTSWLTNHLLSYMPPPARLFMSLSGEELDMTAKQNPLRYYQLFNTKKLKNSIWKLFIFISALKAMLREIVKSKLLIIRRAG